MRPTTPLLTLLLILLWPAAASAGQMPFASPATVGFLSGAAELVLADFNQDGNLDVAAADTASGDVWVFLGDGSGVGWSPAAADSDHPGVAAIAAGDLDGDGDVDLVASGNQTSRELAWYENNGTGTLWTAHDLTSGNSYGGQLALADFDQDGSLDIATWGSTNAVVLLNTSRDATAFTDSVVPGTLNGPNDIDAGDFSGDGFPDLLVAMQAVTPFSTNDGAGGFSGLNLGTGTALSVSLADIDRDGDTDFVTYQQVTGQPVTWWDNLLGNGSSWGEQTGPPNPGDSSGRARVVDLDQDGDPDLLVSQPDLDVIQLLEHPGDPQGTWTYWAVADLGGVVDAHAGDVDNDGDLDVVAYSDDLSQIVWFDNQRLHGEWSFGEETSIATNLDAIEQFTMADLDGDGDLDITGSYGSTLGQDTLIWIEDLSGDGSTWGAPVTLVSNQWAQRGNAVGDLDRDGDLDIVGSNSSSVHWLDNQQGDASAWSNQQTAGSRTANWHVVLADMDGDGDLDAVPAVGTGSAFVHRNDDADAGQWATCDLGGPESAWRVAVADLDGDGDLDLISTFEDSVQPQVSWFLNPGSLDPCSAWSKVVITSEGSQAGLVTGDVDGDGDPDVVAAALGFGVRWFENSNPAVAQWGEVQISSHNPEHIELADLDRDGDLDVVYAADPDLVWQENVDGLGGSWQVHDTNEPTASQARVYDVDRDGCDANPLVMIDG